MSSRSGRMVNVVPIPKIKKEILSDDDNEDVILCRLCCKKFVSDVALRNHAKMEHIDAFATGDPTIWTMPQDLTGNIEVKIENLKHFKKVKSKNSSEQDKRLGPKQTFPSMSSANIMSLASKDVNYIILKSEDGSEPPRKKKMEKEKLEKPKTATTRKEPQPITGPFECLQPSNLVADGICHQIFFSCCEYSTHYRDEHTRRRKGLRCQVCEKSLLALENQQMPYVCEVCDTGFQTNKELSDHRSISHVKLKPFECNVCHKRFTQQGGVQQHMRMHTGDRPFPCTFCTKSFTQKSGLDQHIRIHTKVKPYRCVICNKTFCQSVHLKQHMRTHTNVSPFQCGICEKRFKQSSHLNYHLKYHNPATMTEEQKNRYEELVGLIGKSELVEVEVDQSQSELLIQTQVEVEEVGTDGYVLCSNGSDLCA